MAIKCLNDVAGIGERCRSKNPLGVMQTLFLQVPTDSFSSYSAFATQATINGKIRDKLIFPIHGIEQIEDQKVEDGIYTGNTGKKTKQYDGIKGYRVGLLLDVESHKVLKTYSGLNWRLIKGDVNNNLRATSPDGITVRGFKLSYFEVSDQMEPTGADSPAMTWIEIQEADINEWSIDGVYLSNPDFLVSELQGVSTVVATQVGSVSANSCVVDVAYVDNSRLDGTSSGANYSFPITGMDETNFQLLLAASSSIVTPVTTATESTTVPGRYTVTYTTILATDKLKVIPSIDALHESAYVTLT